MMSLQDLNREELLHLVELINNGWRRIPDHLVLSARWEAATERSKRAFDQEQKLFQEYRAACDKARGKWTPKRSAAQGDALIRWEKARTASKRAEADERRAWDALERHWSEQKPSGGVDGAVACF